MMGCRYMCSIGAPQDLNARTWHRPYWVESIGVLDHDWMQARLEVDLRLILVREFPKIDGQRRIQSHPRLVALAEENIEPVVLLGCYVQKARPSDGEIVGGYLRMRSIISPVEENLWVRREERRAATEVHVIVIRSL